MKLFSHPRSYVYLLILVIYLGVYLWTLLVVPSGILRTIRLEQMYGIIAITFLYFAVLADPLAKAFPTLFLNDRFLKSKRALVFGAFFFAFLHIYINFFYQLGGFVGLSYLSNDYLIAIIIGVAGFLSLLIFEIIPLGKIFQRIKIFNKLVYVAGLLILIHALLLGTHFADLSSLIPQIFLIALSFLLIIEAGLLAGKYASLFVTILLIAVFIYLNFYSKFSFSIHSESKETNDIKIIEQTHKE